MVKEVFVGYAIPEEVKIWGFAIGLFAAFWLMRRLALWHYCGNKKFHPQFFCETITEWGKNISVRRVLVKATEDDDPDWIDFYKTGWFFLGYDYHAQWGRHPTKVEHEHMKDDWLKRKPVPKIITVDIPNMGFCWPDFDTVKKLARPGSRVGFRRTEYGYNALHSCY